MVLYVIIIWLVCCSVIFSVVLIWLVEMIFILSLVGCKLLNCFIVDGFIGFLVCFSFMFGYWMVIKIVVDLYVKIYLGYC